MPIYRGYEIKKEQTHPALVLKIYPPKGTEPLPMFVVAAPAESLEAMMERARKLVDRHIEPPAEKVFL